MSPREPFRPYTRPKSRNSRYDRGWRSWVRWFTQDDGTGGWWLSIFRPRRVEQEYRDRHVRRGLLIGTAAAVILVGVALFAWHRWQFSRLAAQFQERIDEARRQEDWYQAAEWSRRLVRLEPGNRQARLALAENYQPVARTPAQRTLLAGFYEDALLTGAEAIEIHRRLAELYSELNKDAAALKQADALLARLPDDPLGWRIKAGAMSRLAVFGGSVPLTAASEALIRAIELNPSDVALPESLAQMYRTRLTEPGPGQRNYLANQVMDELVQKNSESAEAYLARYFYRHKFGLPRAEEDLTRALTLSPSYLPALMAAAEQALARGQFGEAADFYRRAAEATPGDRATHLGLGDALWQAGQADDALQAWRNGLKQVNSGDPWLGLRLCESLLSLGRQREARIALAALDEGLDEALADLPRLPRALVMERRNQAWAQWYSARGEYRNAIGLLRQVMLAREARVESPEGLRQYIEVAQELADCYQGLEMPDLSATVHEALLRVEPTSALHHLAAAKSWLKAGRVSAAAEHLQTAVSLPGVPSEAAVLLVRARLEQQFQRPRQEQDWRLFDRALQLCKRQELSAEQQADVTVAEADQLAAEGQTDAALELLRTALAAEPGSPRLLEAMVLGEERWGRMSEADRWLERFEQRSDDSVEPILLRVALWSLRQRYREAAELLRGMLAWIDTERREEILHRIALIELEGGDFSEGLDALYELLDAYPQKTHALVTLARVAVDSGNVREAVRLEELLYDIERRDGTLWRIVRGDHLLLRGGEAMPSALDEGMAIEQRVETLRPAWWEGFRLKGAIAQLEGRWGEAISAYERALEFGAPAPIAVEPLVRLWYTLEAPDRAERYLAYLDDRSITREISEGHANPTRNFGHAQRRIQAARSALARAPGDPGRLIRLGRFLADTRQNAEAELMFRRAIQLAPDEPEAWLALSRFYASNSFSYAALQSLAELANSTEVDAVTRAFTLARCYEMLDEFEQAAVQYRYAASQATSDLTIQRRAASFFLSRDPVLAEHLLRHVLKLDPSAVAWRRQLARLLTRRGDPAAQAESVALLTSDEVELAGYDLRFTARSLAGHGTAGERQLAVLLLEQVRGKAGELPPSDQLLLAELYHQQGHLDRAREAYATLVNRPQPTARELAGFVDLLLSQQRFDQAAEWFRRLQPIETDPLRALQLEARLLKAQDPSADVAGMIRQRSQALLEQQESSAEKARLLTGVAQIYQRLGQPQQAEDALREVVQLDPPSYPALARLLVELNRTAEAVELCLKVSESDLSSQVIATLGQILASGRASIDDVGRVQFVIMSGANRYPREADVQFAAGMVRYMQGNSQEAIDNFRSVIGLQPDHVPARDKLAQILSHSAQTQTEAEQLITQALALAGPQPALLDTQAMVWLRQGKVDQAREALTQLVAKQPAAVPCLHLAIAHRAAGQDDQARAALDQAFGAGLFPACLPAIERLEWSTLQDQLGTARPPGA